MLLTGPMTAGISTTEPDADASTGGRGYGEAVALLRGTVTSGATTGLAWRRAQLDALRRMISEQEESLTEAITADYDQGGWTAAHAIDGNTGSAWGIPRPARPCTLSRPRASGSA